MKRPLIGLTMGPLKDDADVLQVRATYIRAVEQAGGVPVPVPPLRSAALHELLGHLNGLIFPGGLDVEPAVYGEARDPRTEINPGLDALELEVAHFAIDSEVPTLGICRGQQLLNVALGGSLVQHIDDHRQQGSRSALTHALRVEPGSRLADVLGATELNVNTLHHQAVDRLGRGLRAVAWAPDGTVEGLESETHPWLVSVQFHPEELVHFHTPSVRLLSAFVDACRVGLTTLQGRV